jgi:hypothetical protein
MLALFREWVQFQSEESYEAQATFTGISKAYYTLPESFECILRANCQVLCSEQGMAKCWGHSEQAIATRAASIASR